MSEKNLNKGSFGGYIRYISKAGFAVKVGISQRYNQEDEGTLGHDATTTRTLLISY